MESSLNHVICNLHAWMYIQQCTSAVAHYVYTSTPECPAPVITYSMSVEPPVRNPGYGPAYRNGGRGHDKKKYLGE